LTFLQMKSATCVVSLHKLNNKQIRKHQESLEYYLYKISRVTGHSEYDVFSENL
jgi:hypothetical protein